MVTLNTGTAADLLHFETIRHVTKNCERLTRVPTSNESWIVKDWDGETYHIHFDSNFSKKHLFTFSKDHPKTQLKAQQLAATSGKSDVENWHDAEIELLKNKIAKNIDKRAVADSCSCHHTFGNHLIPNTSPPPQKVPGSCTICGYAICAAFQTPYGIARQYVGKPTHDPLAGAKTTKNTCIILNWIPKVEFESVVVQSLQAVEKPSGWANGQPLAVTVGQSRCLKWDFTVGRKGAIIVAEKTAAGAFNYTDFQACWVQARKTASAMRNQTWEIYHMDTGSPPGVHSPSNHANNHRPF